MIVRSLILIATVMAVSVSFGVSAATSGTRLALVIGNSDYRHVSNLYNPANDAVDIGHALERIGFKVTKGIDLDYRGMRLALRDFTQAAADAEIVVIYFAGHGIEIEGTNYLIPVNAELRSDRDVEFEAIRLESVVASVADIDGLKLILVDACRNNPFLSGMTRTSSTRSIGRGLGRIEPGGVLVGYAARGGTLALDGDGRNSPYAQALLTHIEEPGLELGKMFRKVRDTVYDLTDGFQEPFTYGSLPGEDIFLVPAAVAAPSPEESVPDAEIGAAFAEADRSANLAIWNSFLDRYSKFEAHPLVDLAVQRREALLKQPDLVPLGKAMTDTRAEQLTFEAASKANTPRAWAHYFDRFPRGKNRNAALVADQNAYRDELHARIYGRFRRSDEVALSSELREASLLKLELSQDDTLVAQAALKRFGFYSGALDGLLGQQTVDAIIDFQKSRNLVADGVLDRVTLDAIGLRPFDGREASRLNISSALAIRFDAETFARVESDDRVIRIVHAFPKRRLVYGFYNDKVYAVLEVGRQPSWEEANDIADRAGGHLATLTTPEENAFVFELLRYDRNLWTFKQSRTELWGPAFGLYRKRNEGGSVVGWRWVTGEPVRYQNWVNFQPTNEPYEDVAIFIAQPGNGNRISEFSPAPTWGDLSFAVDAIVIEIE